MESTLSNIPRKSFEIKRIKSIKPTILNQSNQICPNIDKKHPKIIQHKPETSKNHLKLHQHDPKTLRKNTEIT